MPRRVSRRTILRRAAAIGAIAIAPARVFAQASSSREPYTHFTVDEAQTLEAIVARLIPSDEHGPGALEAGAARYIDSSLGDALAASREIYRAGLAGIDDYARRAHGLRFADLDDSAQDSVLEAFDRGVADESANATAYPPDAREFFELVLQHTIQGTFCDPYYGGNRDFIGWEMLGYPGLRLAVSADDQKMNAQPSPTNTSAYDLPMFDADEDDAP
jgi:gluconate 2-dehydrogenase gamma chain